eukprot:TRINITY_DN5048_c0_g1_i2.p1 TRINITY_DN5048_c0_g1~~TRINITY_DN5048_c0_g1_i2.p1  ORF type:complete len:143 (-),score=14.50 TRINITY_DN5048_c0_g1_i2:332-760(-)
MGSGNTKKVGREKQTSKKREKEALKILEGDSLENLKEDWCSAKKIAYHMENGRVVSSVDINTTSINRNEFQNLMNADMSARDLDALFQLYDYDHDGTITWREYICVITLLLVGDTSEKVRCMERLRIIFTHRKYSSDIQLFR